MNISRQENQLKKQCGIVIPVFNFSRYLGEVLDGIKHVQDSLVDWRFAVLVVDDGSQPPLPIQHVEGLQTFQLRNRQNLGKGAALRRGFRHFLTRNDINAVIALDADMQHPPEYIPKFIDVFEKREGEVISGRRKRDIRIMPFHRILSNWLTSLIISLMTGQKVPDSQCGFRLYSRAVLQNVKLKENRFHFESEFLIRCGWQNYRISHVPIPTIYNDAPSAISHFSDTLNFITLISKLIMERLCGHA